MGHVHVRHVTIIPVLHISKFHTVSETLPRHNAQTQKFMIKVILATGRMHNRDPMLTDTNMRIDLRSI